MAKPVVIFGTGDFARVAVRYLRADSPHEVVAFTVDAPAAPEEDGLPVVPFETLAERYPPDAYAMFVAIGYSRVNAGRAAVYDRCKAAGYELISYVHSGVTLWDGTGVGDNTFIFEQNVIQPFVQIGSDVVIWSGNHVGHDTTIGDHVFIASHAVISGNCTIGDYCFVGVNATFRNAVTVAPRCVIGAAAVIMRDTDEGDVFVVRNTPLLPRKSWDLKI